MFVYMHSQRIITTNKNVLKIKREQHALCLRAKLLRLFLRSFLTSILSGTIKNGILMPHHMPIKGLPWKQMTGYLLAKALPPVVGTKGSELLSVLRDPSIQLLTRHLHTGHLATESLQQGNLGDQRDWCSATQETGRANGMFLGIYSGRVSLVWALKTSCSDRG